MTVALEPAKPAEQDVDVLIAARSAGDSGRGRQLREAARLTQADVARLCGVTPTTVSLWESAKRIPSGAAACRYGWVLQLLEERLGQPTSEGATPAVAGEEASRDRPANGELYRLRPPA